MENPAQTAQVFAAWAQIVGPEVAAKCRPSSLRGGVLRVRTESPAWAGEFRYLSGEVVARINAWLGTQAVVRIKPWVGPAVGEKGAREAPPPRAGRPGPEATARADALVGPVPDAKLAGALRKAFMASRNR